MNTSTSLLRRSRRPANDPTTLDEAMTPPSTTRSRSSSVDSLDEEYFSKTYLPLSNLPTPPLSSHSNEGTRQDSLQVLPATEYRDPRFLGPAVHLTNLIPTSASLTQPSTSLVHALLTRASLPLDTIALAVSILDSLNSRFALSFRKSFPLTSSPCYPCVDDDSPSHIDSIRPEIIPLSALILAVKFLDDSQHATRYYVDYWARGLWTCAQVNYTQWCLMDNLGGRLMPLWEESIIQEALKDMDRAGRLAKKEAEDNVCGDAWYGGEAGMSEGKAIVGICEQLTPSDSPRLESRENVREATSSLTGSAHPVAVMETLPSDVEGKGREPFPRFVDPGFRITL